MNDIDRVVQDLLADDEKALLRLVHRILPAMVETQLLKLYGLEGRRAVGAEAPEKLPDGSVYDELALEFFVVYKDRLRGDCAKAARIGKSLSGFIGTALKFFLRTRREMARPAEAALDDTIANLLAVEEQIFKRVPDSRKETPRELWALFDVETSGVAIATPAELKAAIEAAAPEPEPKAPFLDPYIAEEVEKKRKNPGSKGRKNAQRAIYRKAELLPWIVRIFKAAERIVERHDLSRETSIVLLPRLQEETWDHAQVRADEEENDHVDAQAKAAVMEDWRAECVDLVVCEDCVEKILDSLSDEEKKVLGRMLKSPGGAARELDQEQAERIRALLEDLAPAEFESVIGALRSRLANDPTGRNGADSPSVQGRDDDQRKKS